MQTERLVELLKEERDRINTAILALQGHSAQARRSTKSQPSGKSRGRRGPRQMSADARRRISEAQKRRWAAYKKSK